MKEFGMEELFNVKFGMVKENFFKFFFFKFLYFFLGSTKYNMAASADEENQRIDEWHKFLTEDDDDEKKNS